ncbi:MAG: fumarate hydratase [Desulfarculaceae bacterium]|jgi:fumarate hydratase subunit alpha
MSIKAVEIKEAVRDCLVKAGTSFRPDQIEAYKKAIQTETQPNPRWVLEQLLQNAKAAKKLKLPLCDDTGIPHVIAEVGDKADLAPGWLQAIQEGIALGLRDMPGRPMAVKGNARQRMEQSQGLYMDPGKLDLAPVVTLPARGAALRLTVLLLGGGPAIRGRTFRIFHCRSLDHVLDEAAGWVVEAAGFLGCTPCVIAMGMGRSQSEASNLMLLAMAKGSLRKQSIEEKRVTDLVNKTGVGPLGLGGGHTALGTFIKIGPARASGVRIVSVRPCCCVEPRRAGVRLE